jgi:hypothetical protein
MIHSRLTSISQSALVAGVLALLLAACSGPEDDSPSTAATASQALVSAAPAQPTAEELATRDVTPQAGCSFVQYCNAPGTDGTRCFHQRCDFEVAIEECKREVRQICGRPTCPFKFFDFDGFPTPLPCP